MGFELVRYPGRVGEGACDIDRWLNARLAIAEGHHLLRRFGGHGAVTRLNATGIAEGGLED